MTQHHRENDDDAGEDRAGDQEVPLQVPRSQQPHGRQFACRPASKGG